MSIRASLKVAAAVAFLACSMVALNAGSAAAFSIHSFTVTPTTTQAGGHPDVEIHFTNDISFDQETVSGSNDPRNIFVHLPTGFIGNPHATPICTPAEFSTDTCSPDSQIGLAIPTACLFPGACLTIPVPLYNIAPQPGQAGLLGFKTILFDTPVYTVLSSRTGTDYGLDASVFEVEHVLPIPEFVQILWGVPADPIHNEHRYTKGGGLPIETGAESNSPLTPFLQNPTTCGVTLTSSIDMINYADETDHVDSPYPSTTGCDQLSFNPSLAASPTTTQTDAPSGLEVDLKVPQFQSPTVPSPSEIKASTVNLPAGFSINPNAADGKTSCSDQAARFGTEEQAQCPDFAKVGTVSIDSSALPSALPGSIYLGEPQPGNRYRLILTADGFGVHVKLLGTVTPDPQTGQITVSFENLPQTPFSEFNLHFFGSERGLLATPTQCGTYAVNSTFTPWDSLLPDQGSTQFFTLDSGPNGAPCPGPARPFDPGLEAASSGNSAGAHAPFSLTLTRDDGDQFLSALNVSTPPGLSATIAGIPYCPDAAIAAAGAAGYPGLTEQATPSCPAASQIGTATTGAGAGTHPIYLPGRVYLAGPYKGAPLSLVVITPAVSGPYDLGDVVVRAALNIDPTTAQITAVSDPLPRILEGIPLRLRSIRINLDRPGFSLNPTNCEPMSVVATVFGDQAAQSVVGAHFQVANCDRLAYGPKLSLHLKGGVKRRGHPAVTAVFKTKPGEANSRRVSVALPEGELLDNAHIGNVCTRVQFNANACPAASILGTAEAITPLLEAPLRGNVYLRSSSHELPDLVADLRGQIDIQLVGTIDTVKGGALRTTFETVPDAPVSSFVLSLAGGAKGLLVNSQSLCGSPKSATVRMTGQNGAVVNTKSKLRAGCGSAARHKRHDKHRRTKKAGR
jgi:hypothetical protein